MTHTLSRLLRPSSIAVFGGGWGVNVVEQLLKAGYEGEIWPIHPKRGDILGVRAFPSLDALPSPPDAAWIGVNRDATVGIVRQLSAMGAGGAVCFASGFGESEDGAQRNAALLDAAKDMPIIGPNCYGLLNYLDGATLWPDQHGGRRVESGVAILTQSSNIAINLTMQRRGLPIAYMMTAGNQAQMGLAEMASALLDDPRVTAIGLHVEGVGDTAAFEALARRAREARIPVVAIKVGRSEQARAATVSHTASLAGSEAGSEAFFRRIGIPLLPSLPALMETLKLLHVHGPMSGRDVLSMSCSGGEASLVTDTAQGYDLTFRPYTLPEKEAIAATLNPLVTVANPLDYHTFIWNDEAAMRATFAAAMAPGFDLSMLVLDFPREDRCSLETWDPAVSAITDATQDVSAKTAIVATLPELLPEAMCDAFLARGIAPLCGIEEAVIAANAAACIGEAWAADMPAPVLSAQGTLAGKASVLSEPEAKELLRAHGVPVPAGYEATDAATAAEHAERLGYPVALKVVGLAHKTEADGVALNLRDCASVTAAAQRLLALSDRVLVERMIEGGIVELLVGVTRDPAYGPMLTIGAGGILAELLADTATLLLPTNTEEVTAALDALKVAKLLNGWRGKPAADTGAAVAAILSVAGFAEAHIDTLDELDINPLIVCERGAFAADALLSVQDM